MTLKIISLTASHSQDIISLQHLAPSRDWSTSEARAMLTAAWSKGYGVMQDNELVGFCLIKLVEKEAEILEIATTPKLRRSGCAQALWHHIKQDLPGTTFFLEVAVDNTPALNFYKKMGFIAIGSRSNYYGPGQDALVYSFGPAKGPSDTKL